MTKEERQLRKQGLKGEYLFIMEYLKITFISGTQIADVIHGKAWL